MASCDISHTLAWKELSRTIMALNLSIAQIELSMTEGSHSVDTLIDSFNYMREGLIDLADSILNDEIQDKRDLKQQLLEKSHLLSEKMTASIIAFQFYDKLTQRLQHVSKSLSGLTDIISEEERVLDEMTWKDFLEATKKYAAMREEYELYDLIFNQNMSSEKAIELMKNRMRERMLAEKDKPMEDDIELF